MPLQLCPDYGHSPRWLFGRPWVYLGAVLPVVAVSAMAFYGGTRKAWFVVALFVTGLFPAILFRSLENEFVSTVADRQVYFALLGPAVAVAWVFDGLLSSNVPAHAGAALLLLLYGGLSLRQTDYWRDTQTLAEHSLQINRGQRRPARGMGRCTRKKSRFSRCDSPL